ncbi:hypothetical protein BUE93_20315 [Chromobacterium amazonense]|uniref:Uncharacterized protein n=1 Tax=Chromobacterium amazonense TaxID=1382803 RepID=A0A2S9WZA6_9NEIS|nr:hypothetical protein [Chromobacterium amazonense]PRP68794.1 hypothetical protein BUE93_20315 [Chromobacterium amazonense]
MSRFLKTLWRIVKIVTFPFLLPMWIQIYIFRFTRKHWRTILAVLTVGIIAGCATAPSNPFTQSPCACDFERVQTDSALS